MDTPEPAGREQDALRSKCAASSSTSLVRRGDLDAGEPDDPRDRHGLRMVGDHEVLRAQHAIDVVQRGHPLAVGGAAHHDAPPLQQVEVEGVEGLAPSSIT